jgi:hypothetical protein
MNEPTQAPFAFMPATPKGQNAVDVVNQAAATSGGEPKKRTRRTKAELAAVQGEKQIDPFDAFDHIHKLMEQLPKPVRDRIMSTLNRIYS